ncbi:MAG TPA: hypothetical protein VJU60_03880 [Thermoleophilaceae bacterium]|nr:hypothetical protein [Thermoleophilaceae bacterium]
MAKRGRIDMGRVASTAIETALNGEQQPRRHRMTGLKAVAAGAALATAARVAVSKAPSLTKAAALTKMPRLGDLTDNVRDRLSEYGWIDEEQPEPDAYEDEYGDEDYEDEPAEDEAEGDESEEPVAQDEPDEEDEPDEDDGDEWDDEEDEDGEDDDGPQDAAEDEPEEDEEDAEEDDEEESPPPLELGTNGGGSTRASGGVPDLMAALGRRPRPRVMRRAETDIDPAEQPPEPPKQRSAKQRSTKTKSKAGGK